MTDDISALSSYGGGYNPGMYGMQVDNRVGLARELDPKNALIETIYSLRGELRTNTGKVALTFRRYMNELGISVFIISVMAGANSINTTSNYKTNERLIFKIMNKWILDIVYEFYYNRKRFILHEEDDGSVERCLIEDESNAALVVNLAVGLILPSFFKALGAGDRGAITRSISEMIQRAFRDYPEGGAPTRKGILSRLNPFSKAEAPQQ